MVSLVVLVFGWLKLLFPQFSNVHVDLWFLFILCGCVSKLAYAIVSKEAHSGMNSNSMETTNFRIQIPTLYYCSGILLFWCTRLIKNGWEFAWSHLVGKLRIFSSSNHCEESLSYSLVGKLCPSSHFLVFYIVFALFSYHLFIQSHVEIQEEEKHQTKLNCYISFFLLIKWIIFWVSH